MDILDDPREINSFAVEGHQLLLAERLVPAGKYDSIRLVIRKALIKKEGRPANLALPAEDVEIPLNITVNRQQNISIFINWNPDGSVVDGYMFKPAFTTRSQSPELNTLLIYVTNEDSDNVSVINKNSGAVVATIMVGKKPRGIAAALKGERSRIFVANSGSNTISVIDPTTNRVENEISIRFGRKPEGIAVATVSSGKELVFVTNYDTNSVSVIDSTTFQEIEKIDVGQGPVAVAVDPPVENFLGSRYIGIEDASILRSYRERYFNVYVVNMNSNDVSVIRIDKTTNRSVEVIDLPVEWKPSSLTVDYKRGKVYVVNYGSDKLSVLDIVKICKGIINGAVSTINDVGNFIRGVVADPAFDRIYLLKE
ncbi:MAG: YncE family protein, partial [Nitrospirota bacterium]|nr:YncE family protein [Nitrospirota bacterium]